MATVRSGLGTRSRKPVQQDKQHSDKTFYTLVQVNNVVATPTPSGTGVQYIAYDEPQVVVSFYDGFTGRMLYAEGISTADAKSDKTPAPKESKWPAKDLPGNRGF